ncbi:HD domain-containing protein [Alkaliphilus transvaalensis]|uniref:HD domain-containing protein n=1 Tax=Alkaliphilus transvaalensis TaxID=114628 RepID=UPI00047B9A85|nr:HD domain-containing protein [Alkaliphilus transvaalensis]
MTKDIIIENTIEYVQSQLAGEGSGHDWWHIHRVYQLTKTIAEEEKADLYISSMAALLHDLADEKLNESEALGIEKVKNWLISQSVQEEDIDIIIEIISTISFKGGNGPSLSRLEAKIVQDADRLDAIGAIGIARCFTYGGYIGSVLHDPSISPRKSMTKKEYRDKSKSTTINHFYEKLLKLKDLMNTKTGKLMAEERHSFMECYLKQFYQEWEGK